MAGPPLDISDKDLRIVFDWVYSIRLKLSTRSSAIDSVPRRQKKTEMDLP
jgi:hypothetical protein